MKGLEYDTYDVTDDSTGVQYTVRISADQLFAACTCDKPRLNGLCDHVKAVVKWERMYQTAIGYPKSERLQ